MPKAIFFDMDHTLVDDWGNARNKKLNLFLKNLKKTGILLFLASSRGYIQLKEKNAKVNYIETAKRERSSMIFRLKNAGIDPSLFTRIFPAIFKSYGSKYEHHRSTTIGHSYDFEAKKEIFEKWIKKYKLNPKDVLVIGNNSMDEGIAAKKNGLKFIKIHPAWAKKTNKPIHTYHDFLNFFPILKQQYNRKTPKTSTRQKVKLKKRHLK